MDGNKKSYSVAKNPCAACPYRKDCPSGVWDASEYDKLPAYDADTAEQPAGVFLCHDGDAETRLCRGWLDVHKADELLAIRLAGAFGADLTRVYEAAREPTAIPLFGSGREACEHGKRDIETPSEAAIVATVKLVRRHSRLRKVAGGLTGSSELGIDFRQGEISMGKKTEATRRKKSGGRQVRKSRGESPVRCNGTVSRNTAKARRLAIQGRDPGEIAKQCGITVAASKAVHKEAQGRAGGIGADCTTSDAAWLLGVTERRVRALCQQGRIEASLFGGWAWRIITKSLMEFADSERVVGRKISTAGAE